MIYIEECSNYREFIKFVEQRFTYKISDHAAIYLPRRVKQGELKRLFAKNLSYPSAISLVTACSEIPVTLSVAQSRGIKEWFNLRLPKALISHLALFVMVFLAMGLIQKAQILLVICGIVYFYCLVNLK